MALKTGIVGLPNVGKSTLFNAITNSQVEAANYPFATIEPNVGVVELFDERIEKLEKMVNPEKTIRATIEFTDIAGLVKGASKGEGLGNKFLTNIRETDAIVQVIRCFEDLNITHVSGNVDPKRDMDIINLELLMADIETISNIIKRSEKKVKNTNDKILIAEFKVAKKLMSFFEKEIPARNVDLNNDEKKIVHQWNLLTIKPLLYVGNVAEEHVANFEDSELYKQMASYAKEQGAESIGISAKIESELSQLEPEDKEIFLNDLEIKSSGLDRLTKKTFELLNLATYFTVGVKEVRAWTFKNGYTAPQCAGIIHTDFEKGFIKAEVIAYNDYLEFGGEQGAKDRGKAKLEGKEYMVKDGDICHFRFNV